MYDLIKLGHKNSQETIDAFYKGKFVHPIYVDKSKFSQRATYKCSHQERHKMFVFIEKKGIPGVHYSSVYNGFLYIFLIEHCLRAVKIKLISDSLFIYEHKFNSIISFAGVPMVCVDNKPELWRHL